MAFVTSLIAVVLFLLGSALAGGRTVSFRQLGEHFNNAASSSYTSHYISEPLPLNYGQVVFTDPATTFLKFPEAPIVITGFSAQVVDANNVSVPLSEAYLHHWLVFGTQTPNSGVCPGYLTYDFGVGAESRGTPVVFPEGYGLFATNPEQKWTANIHILRTQKLDPKWGVKNCIECLYAPGKQEGCTPEYSGTFSCCGDNSQCPIAANVTYSPKVYHLRYTVHWKKLEESKGLKPLKIYVLDASNCEIEYNIYPNALGFNVTSITYTAPETFDVVFAVGHQHIAGYNITLYHGKTEQDLSPLCVSSPVYGTVPDQVGNEKGYVVAIPPCRYDQPYRINQGEKIKVVSLYNVANSDPRTFNVGMHGGVMSLFYVAGVVQQ